jgi:hypothetical protein
MTAKKVQFNELEIIEFTVILGDNPACRSGPAIQLSWMPQSRRNVDLDFFENTHPKRRTAREILMPSTLRTKMLQKSGYSLEEINAADLVNQRVKHGRRRSLQGIVSKSARCSQVLSDRPRTDEEKIAEINAKVEKLANRLSCLDKIIESLTDDDAQSRLGMTMSSSSPTRKQISASCA